MTGLTPMFDFRMQPGEVIKLGEGAYWVGSKYGKPSLVTELRSDIESVSNRKSEESGNSEDR